MKEKDITRSLSFPFIVFLGAIIASISLGYYFRNNTDILAAKLFDITAKETVSLIDHRLNEYKACYYDLTPTLSKVYKDNNNSFEKLNTLDKLFCNPKSIVLIEKSKDITVNTVVKGDEPKVMNHLNIVNKTPKFETLLENSFKEMAPKFLINRDSDNIFYISTIIPISYEDTQIYAFISTPIEYIFNPIITSNILNNKMLIELVAKESDDQTIVFEHNKKEDNKKLAAVKRQKDPLHYQESIDISSDHIHLYFTEIRSQDITTIIRAFSFWVNIVGCSFSIIFFITIYYLTQIAPNKQQVISK